MKFVQVVACVMLLIVLTACGQTQSDSPTLTLEPVKTDTPIPTDTAIPTNTNTPEPTPIPGVQVYPVTSLGNSIPWLPLDEANRPMSVYYGFNVQKPPFDNALVRQAFSYAVDREQIAQEATHFKFREVTPATTMTPSQVLGRDLYNVVGINYDPVKATELLKQAGYTSVESFPPVTLQVSTRGEAAPGAYFRMAESIVAMWEANLGITVKIVVTAGGYDLNKLRNDPPELYQLGWGADYVDPDNFLKELMHSNSDLNFGRFSNQEFDQLVNRAATISDPAERQLLYIRAEQILTEEEAGIIPLYHTLFYIQP